MKFLLAVTMLFCVGARADFPPNSAYIPADQFSPMGVTRNHVDDAIKKVLNAYRGIVALQGASLEIENVWADGTVNAYASRIGFTWKVEMLGGFARYPGMTKGGIFAVLCHEVGHHLGQDPRYPADWASCEGQSDYWAQECMKKVYPSGRRAAGLTLAKVLADLSGERIPSYNTPDKSEVNRTYCAHPDAQCRLDTYLAGIKGKPRPKCWYK